MCVAGPGRIFEAVTSQTKTVDNAAPVVTGTQTGVENPIDTLKISKKLKNEREGKKVKITRATGRSPFDINIT